MIDDERLLKAQVPPIGTRFGQLTISGLPFVAEEKNRHGQRHILVPIRCDCPGDVEVISQWLPIKHGRKTSCGCKIIVRSHGEGGAKRSNLYMRWQSMKVRCYGKTHKGYAYYGARGIRVCDEWQRYEAFRDWALANGFQEHLEIDRIDPDGHYSPENCRWITRDENNKRRRKPGEGQHQVGEAA